MHISGRGKCAPILGEVCYGGRAGTGLALASLAAQRLGRGMGASDGCLALCARPDGALEPGTRTRSLTTVRAAAKGAPTMRTGFTLALAILATVVLASGE